MVERCFTVTDAKFKIRGVCFRRSLLGLHPPRQAGGRLIGTPTAVLPCCYSRKGALETTLPRYYLFALAGINGRRHACVQY